MKNSILEKYDKNLNNEIIIKISTSKIENLYEEYDKKSTFIKKDFYDSKRYGWIYWCYSCNS
ncbi:hypothetical protein [Aliarcobacter butzleri]|uniref:hypothetical protein n=1 Tax=Aliarcobacter butzleri TaxID=28197 RepID=UPI00263EC089|nr:hypothetical protein [Aliarcobacter butzleri]MDN5055543.1 hypothetical protein [Aliarcobacter butzleri]